MTGMLFTGMGNKLSVLRITVDVKVLAPYSIHHLLQGDPFVGLTMVISFLILGKVMYTWTLGLLISVLALEWDCLNMDIC